MSKRGAEKMSVKEELIAYISTLTAEEADKIVNHYLQLTELREEASRPDLPELS